ncbi:MAG TPA: glutamyl-tRNA reductase [Spongiibacteraceae bacterium]|nr:glutamyl-tRNA reductase [Spongiibacteraceae bacterium]HCS26684.1 glutamyl-tRNA reductase [Spongiibacteraceae bacterium]
MNLLVLGINHNSAPIAVRERVAFVPEAMEAALQQALGLEGVEEVAILSTCNRTELYVVGADDSAPVAAWLADYHHMAASDFDGSVYDHHGHRAIRHMMTVAAGLDSLVLGEPQILGQMKSCYAVAKEAGSLGPNLERAFQQVFAIAKKVRTDTAIGENPVSVAYAAVSLTQHIFSDLTRCHALLIGAGETIELVARHLQEKGVHKLTIANRTLSRARELAERFGADAILLADIPGQLRDTDIVVASTASQLPILGKGTVEAAIRKRKHRPMLMVDIAVPRDIEPQVTELSDVYLYTVDDLREIVDENRKARAHEALKADEIIDAAIVDWERQWRSLDAVDSVKDYRAQAEMLRQHEMEKALRSLNNGVPAEQVLEQFARGLTNKLIHNPSSRMREAAANGETHTLKLARQLLGLDDSKAD